MATVSEAPAKIWTQIEPSRWFLLIGLGLLVLPSLISVARQVWTEESGIHGPIVLATGLWLLYRARADVMALKSAGNSVLAMVIIVPLLGLYVFARAFDFLSVEIAALGGVLVATLYAFAGSAVVKRLWFPIFYLFFLVPLPGWFVDQATSSLKTFVSWASMLILNTAGYPIARIGVTLYVAQFQLLVEDACSGMNSLISLSAISLFYIYLLHSASWRYALYLMCWILPVAIFANILRVLILVLLTYHFGNEVAQGFLHNTAGMVMFVSALLGIFAVDRISSPFFVKKSVEHDVGQA